jgi:eukaryotic-like serine/threonine-protein kinase
VSTSSRPALLHALARDGTSPSEEDVERFYGGRVAEYAKLLMVVFAALYVMGIVVTAVFVPELFWVIHVHPSKLSNLGLVVLFFGIWQLARKSGSRELITASDALLPLSVTMTFWAVSLDMPPVSGMFFGPLLIGALVLMFRAALVPSHPRRTALVGAVASIPVVASVFVLALHDPSLMPPLTPPLVSVAAVVWCVALLGSTSMISRVIYGLHREIARAKRLGAYVLGVKIGEGGMGEVFLAEHALLKRPAAVKLLLPDRAGPENIARFEREVRLTAQLTHPNTVAVYDYGRSPDGTFYYAMEFLDGMSLDALVDRFGPQPPGRVIQILLQAVGALTEAHALGLIHRDIKPANILFCQRGGLPDVAKLVDFGLVKNISGEADLALTHGNTLTGTPLYISPEAIVDPGNVTHCADIYGLGGVAYYLLTAHPPFAGRNLMDICAQHLHSVPLPPSDRSGLPIPSSLDALVLRCLAKSPAERPDVARLHEELLQCAAASPPWTAAEARAWWKSWTEEAKASSRFGSQTSEAD